MPIREYMCQECEHCCEFLQDHSEGYKRKCPECGKLTLKVIFPTRGNFTLKGPGWYKTGGY